jgi:hypothetical protein
MLDTTSMTFASVDGLRSQLEAFRAFRAQGRRQMEYPYQSIEDFVLRNGLAYVPAQAPWEPLPRACYQESYRRAARARSPWIYVEGYAMHPKMGLATPHAWVSHRDYPIVAFDCAWDWGSSQGAEYLGVPFRFDYVRRIHVASGRKQYGVLEAGWMHFPLMIGVDNIEDVVWRPKTKCQAKTRQKKLTGGQLPA